MHKKSKICYKITHLLQTCACVCNSNFGKMHTCVRCACGRKSNVRMCMRARPKIVATHSLSFCHIVQTSKIVLFCHNVKVASTFYFILKIWGIVNSHIFSRLTPNEDSYTKGQIISECPYEIIVSPKIPTKKFPRFLPCL